MPPSAEHPLLTDVADQILRQALHPDGVEVRSWRRTRIHPRGSSLSVRFDVDVSGADQPTLDIIGHTSGRPIPPGAAAVRVGTHDVHVWRFPHDPYLPGLPPASSSARVAELLVALGAPTAQVRLRTRAYRPSRRAVIEVRSGAAEAAALYLKVLGGRTSARVGQRARDLAEIHRTLTAAGVPVAPLVGVAERQGIVAIARVPGESLRAALLLGHPVPPPGDLVDAVMTLAATDLPGSGDPRAFADPSRHVPLLSAALPDLVDHLEEAANFAATAGGPSGTVHGDLHDGQALIHRGQLAGFIDLDGAGPGLVAHDAGRMLAYLEHAAEVDPRRRDRVHRYADELHAGFTKAGVPTRDLAAGAAAAWIGLATAPYRSRHAGWQDQVRDAIERALRWTRSV